MSQVAQQAATPKPGQPATPAPPAPPAQATIPVPTTERGIDQLRIRAQDIKNQLQDLTTRRRELLEQSVVMPASARTDLNGRIAAIDQRSAMLEREQFMVEDVIAQASTNRLIRSATGGGSGGSGGSLLSDVRDVRAVQDATRQAVFGSVFGVLALYLMYSAFRRFIWRRRRPAGLPDYGPQISQLQQSIDVIALEVERISEGQRYVAKVLGDKALGAGAADPVSVPKGEAIGARAHRP